jgi:hypothetical protein
MRVPSFERFQRMSAAGAFFVCGMVVGAALWSGLANEQYNKVVLDNLQMAQQLETYKEDLNRAKDDSDKQSTIRRITVFVENAPDKPAIDVVTENELKKRIKNDLDGFRGRSIYQIGKDAQFARALFEKKVYTGIGEADYEVRITTMLAADGVLQVWVTAEIHLQP